MQRKYYTYHENSNGVLSLSELVNKHSSHIQYEDSKDSVREILAGPYDTLQAAESYNCNVIYDYDFDVTQEKDVVSKNDLADARTRFFVIEVNVPPKNSNGKIIDFISKIYFKHPDQSKRDHYIEFSGDDLREAIAKKALDSEFDDSIKALEHYSDEIKKAGFPEKKYKPVKDLAENIKKVVNEYRGGTTNKHEATYQLNNLIKDGKKEMRNHRRGLDILANVAICLTGIGLVILGIRYAATGKFFVNATTREKKLKDVSKSLKKVGLRKE